MIFHYLQIELNLIIIELYFQRIYIVLDFILHLQLMVIEIRVEFA